MEKIDEEHEGGPAGPVLYELIREAWKADKIPHLLSLIDWSAKVITRDDLVKMAGVLVWADPIKDVHVKKNKEKDNE